MIGKTLAQRKEWTENWVRLMRHHADGNTWGWVLWVKKWSWDARLVDDEAPQDPKSWRMEPGWRWQQVAVVREEKKDGKEVFTCWSLPLHTMYEWTMLEAASKGKSMNIWEVATPSYVAHGRLARNQWLDTVLEHHFPRLRFKDGIACAEI